MTPATMAMGHLKYWSNKLAVETEPGLTSAQLMVRNSPLQTHAKKHADCFGSITATKQSNIR